ncbi:MAG: L-lactate dehydrogenase [Erysipelotrichaceae bacterium]|nr:L-lactate dehydrogenase [Erysipelotrichaceae bacterium]
MAQNRKVVLIGTGFVGMSFAYALIGHSCLDELVLVDVVREKTEGEALDLQHALPYTGNHIKVHAGTYEDCRDATVIVITAGAAQKPGQSRLELTAVNTRIMKSIGEQIRASGFNGIIIVASNPCDLMTYVAWKATGLPREQVFGSGTMLDTARLRYALSDFLQINSANVHSYIMGEHGDSSFVPWTHCYIGAKSLLEELDERHIDMSVLLEIYENVRDAAYEIIEKKKATYYGIGMALCRLVLAVLNNENAIIPLSVYQDGCYGREGLYIGVPAVVNRNGIREVLVLHLNDVDQDKFNRSCDSLLEIIQTTIDPILAEK